MHVCVVQCVRCWKIRFSACDIERPVRTPRRTPLWPLRAELARVVRLGGAERLSGVAAADDAHY